MLDLKHEFGIIKKKCGWEMVMRYVWRFLDKKYEEDIQLPDIDSFDSESQSQDRLIEYLCCAHLILNVYKFTQGKTDSRYLKAFVEAHYKLEKAIDEITYRIGLIEYYFNAYNKNESLGREFDETGRAYMELVFRYVYGDFGSSIEEIGSVEAILDWQLSYNHGAREKLKEIQQIIHSDNGIYAFPRQERKALYRTMVEFCESLGERYRNGCILIQALRKIPGKWLKYSELKLIFEEKRLKEKVEMSKGLYRGVLEECQSILCEKESIEAFDVDAMQSFDEAVEKLRKDIFGIMPETYQKTRDRRGKCFALLAMKQKDELYFAFSGYEGDTLDKEFIEQIKRELKGAVWAKREDDMRNYWDVRTNGKQLHCGNKKTCYGTVCPGRKHECENYMTYKDACAGGMNKSLRNQWYACCERKLFAAAKGAKYDSFDLFVKYPPCEKCQPAVDTFHYERIKYLDENRIFYLDNKMEMSLKEMPLKQLDKKDCGGKDFTHLETIWRVGMPVTYKEQERESIV